MTAFLARRERFASVSSTNDIVRDWLACGTPEVCLAVADEQTAGRGRDGRSWVAPAGTALLLSLGFRPTWLDPVDTWRLAAVASLAMAEAGESVAGLPEGAIRLKWPNDLVIATQDTVRKLAGILGETEGLGTGDPRAVIGIGINVDWAHEDFPADLAGSMTSLREAGGGRRVDRAGLLEAFLERLEARIEALRSGAFDGAGWAERQVTTGRSVRLVTAAANEMVIATGVDAITGALVVSGERQVLVGEVTHVRLAEPVGTGL